MNIAHFENYSLQDHSKTLQSKRVSTFLVPITAEGDPFFVAGDLLEWCLSVICYIPGEPDRTKTISPESVFINPYSARPSAIQGIHPALFVFNMINY